MLNIHPSLAEIQGLNTHARALRQGINAQLPVHEVTAQDDGPILGQISVPILSDDTPSQLATRVLVQDINCILRS